MLYSRTSAVFLAVAAVIQQTCAIPVNMMPERADPPTGIHVYDMPITLGATGAAEHESVTAPDKTGDAKVDPTSAREARIADTRKELESIRQQMETAGNDKALRAQLTNKIEANKKALATMMKVEEDARTAKTKRLHEAALERNNKIRQELGLTTSLMTGTNEPAAAQPAAAPGNVKAMGLFGFGDDEAAEAADPNSERKARIDAMQAEIEDLVAQKMAAAEDDPTHSLAKAIEAKTSTLRKMQEVNNKAQAAIEARGGNKGESDEDTSLLGSWFGLGGDGNEPNAERQQRMDEAQAEIDDLTAQMTEAEEADPRKVLIKQIEAKKGELSKMREVDQKAKAKAGKAAGAASADKEMELGFFGFGDDDEAADPNADREARINAAAAEIEDMQAKKEAEEDNDAKHALAKQIEAKQGVLAKMREVDQAAKAKAGKAARAKAKEAKDKAKEQAEKDAAKEKLSAKPADGKPN